MKNLFKKSLLGVLMVVLVLGLTGCGTSKTMKIIKEADALFSENAICSDMNEIQKKFGELITQVEANRERTEKEQEAYKKLLENRNAFIEKCGY